MDDADAVDIILRRRRRKTPSDSNLWVRAWLDESRRLIHGHTWTVISTIRECRQKHRQRNVSAVNAQCTRRARRDNSMIAIRAQAITN